MSGRQHPVLGEDGPAAPVTLLGLSLKRDHVREFAILGVLPLDDPRGEVNLVQLDPGHAGWNDSAFG